MKRVKALTVKQERVFDSYQKMRDDLGNAHFDCGEHDDSIEEPYSEVLEISRKRQRKLDQFVRELIRAAI